MNKEQRECLQAPQETASKGLREIVCINCNSAMLFHLY